MLHRLSIHLDTVAITNALATTPEIFYGEFAAGEVFLPAGSGINTLTWYAAPKPGGTYHAAYDADGNAIVQAGLAAERSYPIPADLAGSRAIKAVGNAAGSISVSLKG